MLTDAEKARLEEIRARVDHPEPNGLTLRHHRLIKDADYLLTLVWQKKVEIKKADAECATLLHIANTAQASNEKLRAEVERLRATLRSIAEHRERCVAYDEECDHPIRKFYDDDEWDRVEAEARTALGEKM